MPELTEVNGYKINPPLEVSIMEIEGHYYATNVDLEICASGNSEEEALSLFKEYFKELYERGKKLMEMVER